MEEKEMTPLDKARPLKKTSCAPIRTSTMVLLDLLAPPGCTITHKIEPSDKPFVVNMNINHEVKVKIEEQNQDLLSLEQEYLKQKKTEATADTKKIEEPKKPN